MLNKETTGEGITLYHIYRRCLFHPLASDYLNTNNIDKIGILCSKHNERAVCKILIYFNVRIVIFIICASNALYL